MFCALFFTVFSPIAVLYTSCGPSTVLRRIWTVIIYAVNRVFWCWPISHILYKSTHIHPPFTYIYTATSIILICIIIFVPTAVNHAAPRFIHACIAKPVFVYPFIKAVGVVASTALCIRVSKRRAPNYCSVPTHAFAFPIGYTFSSPVVGNHSKPSTTRSRSVFYFSRPNIGIHLKHKRHFIKNTGEIQCPAQELK